MDALRRDLAFAIRSLARQPAFAAVAIVTLALGIGANAAIFSILNALVLRPLPYPAADRLVTIAATGLDAGTFDEWRRGMSTLEAMGAYAVRSDVVTSSGPARNARSLTVSAEFLTMLGARPAHGRLFSGPDHEVGAAPVAIVGPELWSVLGGRDDIGDASVTYGGVTYSVVGVLPAGFSFLRYNDIDLWLPLDPSAATSIGAIGRLGPGATVERATDQVSTLSLRVDPETPASDRRTSVWPLADVIHGEIRAPLTILFGAATLVLLIACVNVANLLLSKATGRSAELTVRSSLGASRVDLVRQLLTENAVLAFLGATAGLLVAAWTADVLAGLAPAYTPRLDEIGVDATVLGFTLLIALACTLAAGLGPALRASNAAFGAASLKHSTTDSRRVLRGRGLLVSAELALALVVLIGSGLLIRTFIVLRPASPGFATANRTVARIAQPSGDPVRFGAFVATLIERIEDLPGDHRAAAVTDMPLTGESMLFPVVAVDGRPHGQAERPLMLHFRAATPGYMDVIEMPIVRGRGLSPADVSGAPPVIVLNENTAGRLWPDTDPVGRTVSLDVPAGITEFTVVGVSADAAIFGGATGSRPEAFVPLDQSPWARLRLVVHSPGTGLAASEIRLLAATIDPAIPLEDFESFDAIAASSVSTQRFQMVLMSLFGCLAFVLSVVGCYSVLATAVARRYREIGLRVALGATRIDIVTHVLRSGLGFILAGLAAGLLAALATTRVLAGVLYGVQPVDPATFAAATAALFATAALAALIPARRAASLEPAEVLRQM